MSPSPTDFYLNLDRWEALSLVERHRGHWEVRTSGPSARLDTMRNAAAFEGGWAIHRPGVSPDPLLQERILSGGELPAGTADQEAISLYARSVLLVNGWFEAFPWTPASIVQILRILCGDRLDPAEEKRLADSVLQGRSQANHIVREIGAVPLLEGSVFLGAIPVEEGPSNTQECLFLLCLRLLLLQMGYLQLLFAPIETPWGDLRRKEHKGVSTPDRRPEEMLGDWLDELTFLLVETGQAAERGWARNQALLQRSPLQEAILSLGARMGRLSAGDVIRLTGANRNTVKDNLGRLVREGLLRKEGAKRGTVYILVGPSAPAR